MSSALTRALRVLAECLGSSTSGRGAAAAVKAVPPSAQNSGKSRINRAAASVFEPLEHRTMMSATYYVSPSGSDSNKGTISSPWRSTSKVSSTHLNPGDHVLFQGGQTFSGGFTLYGDGGSSSNPVVIGSYGSGRAIIKSGTGNGIWELNSTGVTVENLQLIGSRGNTGSQDGIRIENYSNGTTRSGFTVEGCDISGYAQGGIVFGYDSSSEYLNDVRITNNVIYDNIMVGIESYGIVTKGVISSEHNTNIYIGNNIVHDTLGDGVSFSSGSGIELQGLNGAVVERNSSYNNGIHGTGVVGIWCYSSNDVTFQYDQSYNNVTRDGNDGDGFDFDADTSNSIMQYNFASNNYGGGFQLNEWWNDNDETGDIIRYNISQNNGRKNNYAGIDVWGKVENAKIYNNTVYITPALSGTTQALRISNNTISSLKPSNITIVGNIFVSSGGADLVNGYQDAINGSTGIHFAGNVYYASGLFHIVYDGVNYYSLASWEKSTGQEMLNGKAVGLSANPLLVAAGKAVPPASAANLSQITAYNLLAGSPVLTSSFAAIASAALGTLGVTRDFLGNAVPAAVIAGIDESHSAVSVTSVPPTVTSTTPKPKTLTLAGANEYTTKTGSVSGSGTNFTVTGNGNDIWNKTDSFTYAYTTLSGNGTIIAKLGSQDETSAYAKAGIMIRNGSSITAGAAEVSMLLEAQKRAEFETRAANNSSTTNKEVTSTADQWIKLVRSGNTFSGYISANGTTWTLVGNSTVNMSTVVTIGLAVTSNNNSKNNTALFSNVAIS